MQVLKFLLAGVVLLLGACSNLGGAVGSAAQAYWNSRNPPSFAQSPLQPQFTYLEVLGQQSSALLVLAEIDKPLHSNRPVETWVSGSGEVLRTQSGFLVGSAGIPYLPEVAQPTWATSGDPAQLNFNMAAKGLSNVNLNWQPTPLPSQFVNKPSPLLKRAQQVANLQYTAWVALPEKASSKPVVHHEISQLVAIDPATGNLVYGQFCQGGLAKGNCIEYLLRTAARNL